MWVEFVVGSLLYSERFFSGYSGFPFSSKTNISKFQFDHESGRQRTTLWMCYLLLIIYLYLFIHFIFYFYQLLKGQKSPNAMFTMTVNRNRKRTTLFNFTTLKKYYNAFLKFLYIFINYFSLHPTFLSLLSTDR